MSERRREVMGKGDGEGGQRVKKQTKKMFLFLSGHHVEWLVPFSYPGSKHHP